MAVAKNRPQVQTSRALRKILKAVHRLEHMRPLDCNVQRLYRIADQLREAIEEADEVEMQVTAALYPSAAALPIPDETELDAGDPM